jgi:hypothetical protein
VSWICCKVGWTETISTASASDDKSTEKEQSKQFNAETLAVDNLNHTYQSQVRDCRPMPEIQEKYGSPRCLGVFIRQHGLYLTLIMVIRPERLATTFDEFVRNDKNRKQRLECS